LWLLLMEVVVLVLVVAKYWLRRSKRLLLG
jgi:hypothetical protein